MHGALGAGVWPGATGADGVARGGQARGGGWAWPNRHMGPRRKRYRAVQWWRRTLLTQGCARCRRRTYRCTFGCLGFIRAARHKLAMQEFVGQHACPLNLLPRFHPPAAPWVTRLANAALSGPPPATYVAYVFKTSKLYW